MSNFSRFFEYIQDIGRVISQNRKLDKKNCFPYFCEFCVFPAFKSSGRPVWMAILPSNGCLCFKLETISDFF